MTRLPSIYVCPQKEIAGLLTITVLVDGITVVVGFAYVAVEALGVEQAVDALARLQVAVAGSRYVDVVAAVAGAARAAGRLGVAIVVVSAHVTTGPFTTKQTARSETG